MRTHQVMLKCFNRDSTSIIERKQRRGDSFHLSSRAYSAYNLFDGHLSLLLSCFNCAASAEFL